MTKTLHTGKPINRLTLLSLAGRARPRAWPHDTGAHILGWLKRCARRYHGLWTLAFLLSSPVWAQDFGEPPAPLAAPRAQVATLAAHHRPQNAAVTVATNKSTDITLPVPVRDAVVGNPDIADAIILSPTEISIVGRAAGQTNLVLRDRQGAVIRRIEIAVTLDTLAVQDALHAALPNEAGLTVEGAGDSLVLSGAVRSDSAANTARTVARRYVAGDANLVNHLRVANDQQVLLHVKVAEVQRTVLKELGVGWDSNYGKVSGPSAGTFAGRMLTNSAAGLINSSSNVLYGTASITGVGALVANLKLLENQGLIRTLVEPNLTAVSGETATMLAGGELPIPVSDSMGTISVQFKPYGVLLSFTPTVLDPGRLSLKMSTEVSAIDNDNKTAISSSISVPAFKVRRAGSTVELPSGGSLMIAGLLQNDITSNVAGLPGLMDIPVLGALFRSNAFQRNETELVVILSAYVVQPVEQADALALPSDGFAPASDIKRFLFGRLQDTYTTRGKDKPVTADQLQGPFGFIIQ